MDDSGDAAPTVEITVEAPEAPQLAAPAPDSAGKRIWALLGEGRNTKEERLDGSIIGAMGGAGENTEVQKSVRLYTVLSYIAKVAISVVGLLRLRAILASLELLSQFV